MRSISISAVIRAGIALFPAFFLTSGAGAAEPAGRLLFVAGSVNLLQLDGASRTAGKGGDVFEGDTIVTGKEAQAQILMTDQAMIAVRPDSRLKIETFRYSGKENEKAGNDRSFFGLLRGGFRAITGKIGLLNRDAYRVRTPNATIGIRGTDHEPFYIPQQTPGEESIGAPGTYDKVNAGATILQTEGGQIELGPNEVGFVADLAGAAPVRLPETPGFMRGVPAPKAAGARGTDAAHKPGAILPRSAPHLPVPVPRPAQGTLNPANLPQGALPAKNGYAMSGGDLSPEREVGAGAGIVGNPANDFGALLNDAGLVIAVGSNGFNYARDGAPLVDTGTGVADGVSVTWGIYAGGVISDGSGRRTPRFFHFMGGASATPIASLSGRASFGTLGGFTKPINEAGQVGGSVIGGSDNTSIGVNFSTAMVTSYQITVQDARGYTFVGASSGSVPIAQFISGNGTPLSVHCAGCPSTSGDGSGHGVVVGAAGKGMISSYDMKTLGLNGAFGVTGSLLLTRP